MQMQGLLLVWINGSIYNRPVNVPTARINLRISPTITLPIREAVSEPAIAEMDSLRESPRIWETKNVSYFSN